MKVSKTPATSKISTAALVQYEKALEKDPGSKLFAALADGYRELGRFSDAELLARDGIKRHPGYVGGYLVLARVLMATRRADQAEGILKKAVELSPENLLAYQLLGQVFVELKRPTDALKAHKMVLFLNPLSEKSRQAVEKLETLTAVDYEDEVFEMRPLKSQNFGGEASVSEGSSAAVEYTGKTTKAQFKDGDLERSLSLVDALIVRNDLQSARSRLGELSQNYPDSAEVQKRWHYFEDESPMDDVEALRPILSRERRVLERKKHSLEHLLQQIHAYRMSPTRG